MLLIWQRGCGKNTVSYKNVRNKRMISFILTLILFVSFLLLICFIIGPELIHSLKEIVKLAPNAYDQLLIFLKENRNIMNGSFKNIIDSIISLDLDLSALYKTIINNWQSLFHSGFSILSNTLSSLYTFFIGLVFSIYLLFSKDCSILFQSASILFPFCNHRP